MGGKEPFPDGNYLLKKPPVPLFLPKIIVSFVYDIKPSFFSQLEYSGEYSGDIMQFTVFSDVRVFLCSDHALYVWQFLQHNHLLPRDLFASQV